jgi:hypothetical protein
MIPLGLESMAEGKSNADDWRSILHVPKAAPVRLLQARHCPRTIMPWASCPCQGRKSGSLIVGAKSQYSRVSQCLENSPCSTPPICLAPLATWTVPRTYKRPPCPSPPHCSFPADEGYPKPNTHIGLRRSDPAFGPWKEWQESAPPGARASRYRAVERPQTIQILNASPQKLRA